MTYNTLTINQKVNAKGNQRRWDGPFKYERPLMRRVLNRNADLFNYRNPEYLMHFNYKEPRCL